MRVEIEQIHDDVWKLFLPKEERDFVGNPKIINDLILAEYNVKEATQWRDLGDKCFEKYYVPKESVFSQNALAESILSKPFHKGGQVA